MVVKKWKPKYATIEEAVAEIISPVGEDTTVDDGNVAEQKKKKKKKKSNQLSTKGIISRFESVSSCG